MSRRARSPFVSCSLIALLCSWTAPAMANEGPAESMRIAPDVDWAWRPDDGLRVTDFERFHGIDPETLEPIGFMQDGLYFGPDSNALDVMAANGLPPLPAVQYEPSPGVLYLAMDGVTLAPHMSPHSARNRSPLVSQQTTFPSYGSDSQKSALLQTLQTYYQDFDLVLSTNRPPEFVPYTMAVIGGSAATAGYQGGVCGVANVQCDGLKRNHVSLTFPQSCGSGVAATAAQETAHNWGLEHTNNQADLMYPYSTGGVKSFVNSCMPISHATGNGVTQCNHIHRAYCNGNDEQQNSYAELMAAFGPRTPDNSPPRITQLFPEDGAVLTTEDSFTVSARVTENSNFIGAKWTWLEGLPEGRESYTRCTNDMCDDNYGLGVDFDPDAINWDLVQLVSPPEGVYRFQFEVMDAYGNYDSATLRFEVVPPGSSGSGSGGSGSGGDGGDDDGSDGDTDGVGDGGSDSMSSGSDSLGSDDDSGGGKGCRTAETPSRGWSVAALGLLAFASIRRRRPASG